MRKIVVPDNKEHWLKLRAENVNSTEASSLFGISKYASIFELWHYKNKSIECDFTGNERTEWGLALETAIAEKVAKDNGLLIRRMKEYIYDDELRLGSSFDFAINEDGILEIKNVDGMIYKDEWEDNNAPLWIEMQIQVQLAVSERKYCLLAALVGGNNLVLIRRERDEKVIQAIKDKVRWFWSTIEACKEPEPDFTKDAEFIARLYGYAEPEKVLEAGDDIKAVAQEYKSVSDEIKPLEEKKEALKAQLLTMISDAEKVTGDGFTISAGMVGECPISYVRKAYRSFKVNWKKEKKA